MYIDIFNLCFKYHFLWFVTLRILTAGEAVATKPDNPPTLPIIRVVVKQMILILVRLDLKVQSCKLYYNKYMIAATQITNTKIFVFISALVFESLSRKVLFINRKNNRNC